MKGRLSQWQYVCPTQRCDMMQLSETQLHVYSIDLVPSKYP